MVNRDDWGNRNAWWLAPLFFAVLIPIAVSGGIAIADDGWHWWINRAFGVVLFMGGVAVTWEALHEKFGK